MLDMHPSCCIVFEDSLTGIKAAKAAGMRVIGVASSLPPEKLDHTWKVIREFTEIDVEKLKEELKEI
jgi:beta-phosphoglucomutase-like phosphatase (HAD superfamily)